MKLRKLIRLLKSVDCVYYRNGTNHDIYRCLSTGLQAPVPRQKEFGKYMVKRIFTQLGLKFSGAVG